MYQWLQLTLFENKVHIYNYSDKNKAKSKGNPTGRLILLWFTAIRLNKDPLIRSQSSLHCYRRLAIFGSGSRDLVFHRGWKIWNDASSEAWASVRQNDSRNVAWIPATRYKWIAMGCIEFFDHHKSLSHVLLQIWIYLISKAQNVALIHQITFIKKIT